MSGMYTKPLKGICYNIARVGDIAACVCPPYDVISDVAPYYERSPHNAIRLELPVASPPTDQYATAKRTMEDWLHAGVLVEEVKETVYVYEQDFDVEGNSFHRRGFIALHKAEKDRILTHEETRKKAKQDREQLMGTLKAYTSLIFGLYEDKEQVIEGILEKGSRELLYDFVDEQKVRNRFYRMTDDLEMAKLFDLMDQQKIYVADGHHRLDVSYRLNIPFIPLYLTNMYSPGIVIFPYYRLVNLQPKRRFSDLLEMLDGFLNVDKRPFSGLDSVRTILGSLSAQAVPAFVLYAKDDPEHLYVITAKNTIDTNKGDHESLRNLRVNVLHTGILKNLLKISEEEISFTQDLSALVGEVRKGTVDLAALLPPTSVQEVKDIADSHLVMPPKSTFFYPKILTGLVFYRFQ
jgi:uncharacterized protein (DUF1015 family)